MAEHSGDALFGLHSRHAPFDSEGNGGAVDESFEESRLVNWAIFFTKQAQKDAKKIASSNLKPQAQRLLDVIAKRDDLIVNSHLVYRKFICELNRMKSYS